VTHAVLSLAALLLIMVFYMLCRNRNMRHALGCAIALIASGALAGPTATTTESPEIQSVVATKAARYVGNGKVDGLSIAMVRCGKPVFITEGVADRQSARKVTPDTVFQIGSISKTFTALLLAHAVADGKLKLDDDVRAHLPGLYDNLQWTDQTPITLRQLADTSSSLPDYLPDPAPLMKLPAERQVAAASQMLANYGNDDFLRDLHNIKLVAKPGTESRHSNVAAQMLGLILGRVYAKSFAQVLSGKIEGPLGMREGAGPVPKELAATGYDDKGIAPPFRGESITPAGGLAYSARDMARYLELQLSAATDPVRINQQISFDEQDGRGHAFTWLVSKPRPGLPKYRMSGGTFGASSYIEFYPSLDYGIVLMANRASTNIQDELQEIAEQSFDMAGDDVSNCTPSELDAAL
jgi:D-alanyl-D-alanine-carboxypeptidase/D-alanyl-D-alanine-endopeptidase